MKRLPVFLIALPLLLTMSERALAGDLYLNLIWHQHQPLYVDPATDQLRGPWVRTHATKDYYDMAAMHKSFPEVHATINLTSSLLHQLQTYYVDRLGPYLQEIEEGNRTFDTEAYLADWAGKTDPWIDLALLPDKELTPDEINLLVNNPWSAFGISGIQIAHFPEYEALRMKPRDELTDDDYRAIRWWFYLAHFDPDFLRGTADLNVDLSDLLREDNSRFYLKRALNAADGNRLVADAVAVMKATVPVHRGLMIDPAAHTGQLEIITTPFYHPILPLLIDSDVARICQPNDELPSRYAYPTDARAQVVKGVDYYRETFGRDPLGMWPAEGSISEAAAAVFAEAGAKWICGDMHVLERSTPSGLDIAQPYRLSTPNGDIAIVFRETNLSDHIGFTYQSMQPDDAAAHFVEHVGHFKPGENDPDRLLTVILDGENAWEWYEHDMDGKQFLKKLYENLSAACETGDITCVTPTEYIEGNPARDVPAHPISEMTEIEELWPGSWIAASYNTWVGEAEENKAWEYLLQARQDLEQSGLPQPDPSSPQPDDEQERAVWNAYEAIYAAEGSDWFWWYGADQGAPGGDRPFEEAFFSHLHAVYHHANAAGANLTVPEFKPILSPEKIAIQEGGGVMAPGATIRKVRFVCDATAEVVDAAIYIAGNQTALSNWTPNVTQMYDDGTHGDETAGDGLWTLELEFPTGSEIQYKYTNSGERGAWAPSEEFPQSNRAFTVTAESSELMIRNDVFGIPE